jgi:N-sulfoglucosamine sulfohydrolase
VKRVIFLLTIVLVSLVFTSNHLLHPPIPKTNKRPPNILFAIADDQSFAHVSALGQDIFKTPYFDEVAKRGIMFTNAFVAAPQCSPSRAAMLTGKNIWQLEEAGTHSSYFPKKFPVFTDALESAGYFIGYTGKAWDPGNFENAGWERNPVGPAYNKRKFDQVPTKGIVLNDYASNFGDFLNDRPADQPFFFWFGSMEPHRIYEAGSGAKAGLKATDATVPGFLPNDDLVKNDMLDYALEIGWFDKQLGAMISMLESRGELENTIIIVTADNGMAFPYAKANLQEFGTHIPLAICGPSINGSSRKVTDLVGMIDLAPTVLDLAGVKHFNGITGKSLMPILQSKASGLVDPSRSYVLTGRERHTHARPDNLGYPARAIRTQQYLYIKNYAPDRWPAGDPAPIKKMGTDGKAEEKFIEGYEDIDASPTKTHMIKERQSFPGLFALGFEKRNAEQLYDIIKDPYCLKDLAQDKKMATVKSSLKKMLETKLKAQGDPRVEGKGDVFESYPRFGGMKYFDGFKERGKYNPAFIHQ